MTDETNAAQRSLPPQSNLAPRLTPTGYQRTSQGGLKWQPPTPEQLQEQFAQYQILELLGRGGMGAVYRGWQTNLDRCVAIKILPPDLDDADAQFIARFKQEAKTMAKLSHPAIIPVFDAGETATGLLYFIMEYIEGTDVDRMIKEQVCLPADHALAIAAHVCDALHYAHTHDVVHRDIKPANIMVDTEGRVRVADFGLAKSIQSNAVHTRTDMSMGTPDFVAPEALTLGMTADHRADLYAVGVMLYQMLTGHIPRGHFEVPSKLTAVDPRFDAIVLRAMKTDPAQRYQSALEIRRDLDLILTVPLVQAGGESSAALPKQAMPANRKPVAPRPGQGTGAAASRSAAGSVSATPLSPGHPPAKSSPTPVLSLVLGALAVLAVGAWFFLKFTPETPVQEATREASGLPSREAHAVAERPAPAASATPLSGAATTAKPTAAAVAQPSMPTSTSSKPATAPAKTEAPQPGASSVVAASPAPIGAVSPMPGGPGISATALQDAAAPKVAVTAPSEKFPPAQWVKVFTKFEDLPEDLRKAGMKFEDGWIRFPNSQPRRIYAANGLTNYGIRAKFLRPIDTTRNSVVMIRARHAPEVAGYLLSPNQGEMYAARRLEGEVSGPERLWVASSSAISLPQKGEEYSLEWCCVGNKLIARLGERFVKVVADSLYPSGPGFFTGNTDLGDIEVINLDGIPEAEALRILGVDEKGSDLRALAAKQEQQKAEQAKAADTITAIPELKALHDQLTKLTAERVTAPFEADVAKLNSGYLGGIDRKIAEERGKGNLDGVLTLEEEKKLISAADVAALARARPAASPIPEDTDATPANLKGLRTIYRTAFAKLEATHAANLKALTDPLSIRLKQLESTLTQANRIEHAKTVREYREKLGKEGTTDGIAGTPARNATTGGAAATTNEVDNSVRAPLKKFPPGDDRKAAEWAIDLGGFVRIAEGTATRYIRAKADLPKRSFDLVAIHIDPEPATKPAITYTDLAPIAGLRNLKAFQINDYPVTDAETDVLASLSELELLTIGWSREFKGAQLSKLNGLKSLIKVSLVTSSITEEGIAQLGQLENLAGLTLSGCYLAGADLAPLIRLKNLTSLSASRSGVTLDGWRQLKGLPLADIAFTPATESTDEWCRELAKLFPALTRVSCGMSAKAKIEDASAFSQFPKLRTLVVSCTLLGDADTEQLSKLDGLIGLELRGGTDVNTVLTDAGIVSLLALKSLNRISLDGMSNLTPGTLSTLSKLKPLKTLELRNCAQLSAAAIATFQKARPDVTVTR
ncbi:MAG: protein kinase domain-containing protein [Roseimicrobium sp.]